MDWTAGTRQVLRNFDCSRSVFDRFSLAESTSTASLFRRVPVQRRLGWASEAPAAASITDTTRTTAIFRSKPLRNTQQSRLASRNLLHHGMLRKLHVLDNIPTATQHLLAETQVQHLRCWAVLGTNPTPHCVVTAVIVAAYGNRGRLVGCWVSIPIEIPLQPQEDICTGSFVH